MIYFNLSKIAYWTECFLKSNQQLAYSVEKLEEDEKHVLYQAVNNFSFLYCQITDDINTLIGWREQQELLYRREHYKTNRYFLCILPDTLIKQKNFYEELTRAEQDNNFFRKIFVGISDNARKEEVEHSLADRFPLWFEERTEVIRQYVPTLSDVIQDEEFLDVLMRKAPSNVTKTIEEQRQFSYLLNGELYIAKSGAGLQESTQVQNRDSRRLRITGIDIQNFRRFEKKKVDLDGDVILIYGKNGTGKTSVCDALELSIFPEIRRLNGDPDVGTQSAQFAPFIRAGALSDCAYVTLTGMDAGKNFTINTMVRANETVKSLNGIGVSQEDVVKFLTRTENVNKKGFLDILLHTHFLGQHSIRDFIYGNRLDDDDKITSNRYNLLAEMFGFGEIEQIKRRLTGVLTHIKRSKVNGAAHNIEAIKTQIRGLQHKYGIKNRHDLEKKGYQITTENAVERYYAIVGRVGAAIGASFIRQLLVPANSPMETYQASCESVITLINKELKSLESRASDIKRLGRIVARINMIFPDVAASNTISIREFLGDIRQRVSKSIEVTEQNERKLQAIDREIEVHDSNIKNLRQFIQGYDQYSELLALERNEIESLARIQKVKNELLQKQSHLLVRSQHAAGEEQTEKRFLIEMEGRARKYGDLLASLDQIKAAEIILQQEVQRQYVIEEAIGQYREKLKRLDEQTTKPDCDGALQSPNLDLDLFRMDDYYKCPCCGTKFEDKHEFEKSLHGQLSIGRFRKELLAFFTELERRNVETLKAHIRQTIFEYTQERTNLERSSRTKSRAIEAFYGLASELGESKQISEKVLRDAFDKYNSIVRTTRQSIDSHEAKALRVALSKLATELNDLKDDDHKKQLSIVQDNIIKKTRTLKGVISSDEIQDLTKIQARLEGLSTELYELNCRRDHISNEIRVGGLDEKSQKTVDESVSELESLLLKQDAFRIYPLNSTTNLEKENIDRQKMCYELLAEMNELIKLMGCLTAQERSETLKNQLNRYEKEKNRWELCYQSIERLNNELSKLSSSGLHESLAQYGPLVNQIYQKFIRHDIFSALILKAKASPKARKRDLYLRLKSYSGDAKYTPASYLSEAQLNILALSIFLTRVMYQNISALETVFIDDPIQQMDDMNTAAFVDIVLGLSTVGKQIIITTCNHDFYRLVAHKMHSLATGGRITFKAIDLDSGQE